MYKLIKIYRYKYRKVILLYEVYLFVKIIAVQNNSEMIKTIASSKFRFA
jgi:hypothetical protein